VATATIGIRFYQALLEIMRGCICAILWIDIIPNKDDICSNADMPKLGDISAKRGNEYDSRKNKST